MENGTIAVEKLAMGKLSVVISAYNEEVKLPACLESVAFADEIIVVDNESSDKTVEIAKKYKAKVYSRPNNLMLNVNKNYGFTKATGDWVLNLDADERVSDELKQEIQKTLNQTDSTFVGFQMPRKNIIFGRWIRHTGWYPDYHLRLFKKGKGTFAEKHVHEKLTADGDTGTLTGDLIHESYDSIMQFMQKMYLIYAPNEAEQLLKKGYVFSYLDAIRFPFQEFIGRFFAREGYKDGFHGLMLSLLMAFYHFIVFANLWENKKFIDENVNSFDLVSDGLHQSSGELRYWIYEKKIRSAKSSFRKVYLKILRKLPHI